MSDPVIKGAKRTSSRPTPRASTKTSAKSRKVIAKPARPKPQRAAEKAPVRKAAPAKTAASKKSTPAKKKAERAPQPKKAAARTTRAAAPTKTPAPGKKKIATKALSTKAAPASASKGRAAKPAPKPSNRPAPAPPRQPSRDEAAALKAFERAHREFARGHFGEARSLFRALIEQHAGVSEVTARARTYLTIADARLRTEAVLPRDPDSLYDRGVIELNRGDFVAAQEMFERALKRDPEAADTHYALAATRARLGAVETALQALERAVVLKPVLRIRAQADADFSLLRSEPEFERIIFAAPRA